MLQIKFPLSDLSEEELAKNRSINLWNKWEARFHYKIIKAIKIHFNNFIIYNSIKPDSTKLHIYLWIACRYANMEIVSLMIKLLENKTEHIWNKALIAAAIGSNMEIVHFIIEKGANEFVEPLIAAAMTGNEEVITYLAQKFESKFDDKYFELKEKFGLKPIIRNYELNEKEIFYKEDMINIWNRCLSIAARSGYFSIVEFFLNKGAIDYISAINHACDANKMDKFNVPLENLDIRFVCGSNDLNIVKNYILIKNSENYRPIAKGFFMACLKGNINIVKYLMKTINHLDTILYWNEGLYRAAWYGHMNIINLMIEKVENLPLALRNKEEETKNFNVSLEFACKGNHLKIVEFFYKKRSQ